MCALLTPNSFVFGGSGESQLVSCDTASCCCPPGSWGVKKVRKNGEPVPKKRFKMTENTGETTVSYGTLKCKTDIPGDYEIILNCGNSLSATVG